MGEIQQRVGVEPSNVSQHLGLMRRHGLVAATREGTSIRYEVAAAELFALLDVARAIFEKQHDEQARVLRQA